MDIKDYSPITGEQACALKGAILSASSKRGASPKETVYTIKGFGQDGIFRTHIFSHTEDSVDMTEPRKAKQRLKEEAAAPYGGPDGFTPLRGKNAMFSIGSIRFCPQWLHATAGMMPEGAGTENFRTCYNSLYSMAWEEDYLSIWPPCQPGENAVPIDSKENPALKGFILRIGDMRIDRREGNRDKNTFDTVSVSIGIPMESMCKDRDRFIRHHKIPLVDAALSKIASLPVYRKFLMTAGGLVLAGMKLMPGSELQFTFTLKERKEQWLN